jgi:two-component system, LuxR family, sensor kinase FixL
VADMGPGVAAEMTQSILEPFTTTKSLGLGMGLSISRAIIESHGGSLRTPRGVRSAAMFIFDLPMVEAEMSADVG